MKLLVRVLREISVMSADCLTCLSQVDRLLTMNQTMKTK